MSTIVDSKPNVDPNAGALRSRSKVPFSAHTAGTYRFGEYSPHFVMESLNNDDVPLRSVHQVRSYTLKAPLMSNISMKKDYFQVPMEAILPLNWDKVYTNPVHGDDVNAEDVNCVLQFGTDGMHNAFGSLVAYVRSFFLDADGELDEVTAPGLTALLKYAVFLERFFSSGSLLASLRESLSSAFSFYHFQINGDTGLGLGFDDCFDRIINKTLALYLENYESDVDPLVVYIKGEEHYLVDSYDSFLGASSGYPQITLRDFLSFIRDDNDWYFDPDAVFSSYVDIMNVPLPYGSPLKDGVRFPLNLSRPLAYQIACAHFYSNDKIDYVYSAELWRQNLKSVWYELIDSTGYASTPAVRNPKFTVNGIECDFDICSGKILNTALTISEDFESDNPNLDLDVYYDFWRLILGFNRSLRFVDYFTGAKSQPLAVGDVSIDVNTGEGTVNAIDVTRNLQKQKFLNFVNRIGRKFESYVAELGGHRLAPDYHNPFYLAHTSDDVYTVENENTGEAQLSEASSVTSVFMSNASKYAFEIKCDRPSILIGITYFDIPRYYPHLIERQNFHVNRYDMFNPYMQFIGDQPIYRAELTGFSDVPAQEYFGYSLRHLEYKTRVNQCFGGFANGSLPGWQFIADENRPINDLENIGPEYIRSRQSELDRFYVSLTGWSLGTYFHFIIDNFNDCEPVRPMVYAPTIL